MISERGKNTPPSPIRKLVPYANAAREKGINILHLNIGQPDIQTPPEYFETFKELDHDILAYGPTEGMPVFIESMLKYYHLVGLTHLEKNDITVTTGGSEAILFAVMAIASPGEEILVFEPFYANFEGFASMSGVKTIAVPSHYETGYGLPTKKEIEAKITPKTRGMYYCSPNNPTGYILSEDEIRLLGEIAQEHGLFIIADEVYREFSYNTKHVSLLNFPELYEHAIVVDSLSKRHSACGARVGTILSKNDEFKAVIMKFGQARLCPPSFEQLALSTVVDTEDRYFPEFVNEYKKRRDFLVQAFNKIPGVHCHNPAGAFHMMIQLPVDDVENFCRWLLTDYQYEGETIMMAPGPGFYITPGKGSNEARITYVQDIEKLERALLILRKSLEVYHKSE